MSRYNDTDHRNNWSDADVEAHWDRVAGIYVAENNKVQSTHDQRFDESLPLLALESNSKILNISSRDAGAEPFIKNHQPNCSILHAEISAGLMREASKLWPGIHQLKLKNYSHLPFDNARFDRILSLETLEHVADPLAFLNELCRVSTANARMVLSCPPATSELPYRIYTALFGGHGEGPHRFLASAEVKAMLHKSGWKLLLHKGTVLVPVGPAFVRQFGERFINAFQGSILSEMGIRQFYVCCKY